MVKKKGRWGKGRKKLMGKEDAASLCVCERETDKESGVPPAAVCRLGVHGG